MLTNEKKNKPSVVKDICNQFFTLEILRDVSTVFTSISAGISGGTTSIGLAQGIALLVVIVGSLLDAFSLPTSYKCTCPSTVRFNHLLAVAFAGLQTVGYCQCSDTSLVKRNTSTKEKIQVL